MDWKEKYEALFNRIVSVKYGRPIDFQTIERKVSHLRDGDAITYEDLETIAREDLWPFKKYWMWPAREQIEDKLEDSWGVIIDPAAKWDEEEDMIGKLLDIFKHISEPHYRNAGAAAQLRTRKDGGRRYDRLGLHAAGRAT